MATAVLPRRSAGRRARTQSPGPRRVAGPPPRPDIHYIKQIDNSRLVRVADPYERRQFLLWLLVGVMLFAVGLAYTWQRFELVRYGYSIEELKSQRDRLMEANRQLRLEEASLRSPERIDALARNQLGLGPPSPGQVVKLEEPGATPEGVVFVAWKRP